MLPAAWAPEPGTSGAGSLRRAAGRDRMVHHMSDAVVDLPAGPHTVEIRNGAFPAHVEKVVVKPGEPVRIRHRFH